MQQLNGKSELNKEKDNSTAKKQNDIKKVNAAGKKKIKKMRFLETDEEVEKRRDGSSSNESLA